MSFKDIKQLTTEIDAAVHSDGPAGKTTASGLNSVLKSLATELIAHEQQAALVAAQKADLDAGGRVPSAQLPSYVDDILEATTYAALPTSGEAGKVYVTLDTNKQYRWSGSGYAQLSDSGLTTDQLAAVRGATTSPSAANPFVTAADLPANEKKIRAIRVVSATRERLFYTGLGTVENPAADGLKMALAAAQPGDTVQQITNANLPGIVGSNVASANGEQVRIPRGVNYDTGGFDIDTLATSDGITLIGGTGVVNGRNATIYNSHYGTWGIGWFQGDTLDYRVYDLHIHTGVDGHENFATPSAIYLPGARLYHRGNIYSEALWGIGGIIAGTYCEHEGTLTLGRACTGFLVNGGQAVQRGDVKVTANAAAGVVNSGRLEMYGGILDLRAAQARAGFQVGAGAILELTDVTVLGMLPAYALTANQSPVATVRIYGDTVVPAGVWEAGLLIEDFRPAATGGSTPGGTGTTANCEQGQYLQISSTPAARVAELPLPARYTLADEVLDLNATAITYQLDKNTRTGTRQYGAPNQTLSQANAQLAALTDAELAAGAKLYISTTPSTNAPSIVGLTLK